MRSRSPTRSPPRTRLESSSGLEAGQHHGHTQGRGEAARFRHRETARAGSHQPDSRNREIGGARPTAAGTIWHGLVHESRAGGRQTGQRRSDVFSFVTVTYEMVTGQCPFQRDSTVTTLAAVLKEDTPPLGELVSGVPVELQRSSSVVFARTPEGFQHMDDVGIALQDIEEALKLGLGATRDAAQASSLSRRFWGITMLSRDSRDRGRGYCGSLGLVAA